MSNRIIGTLATAAGTAGLLFTALLVAADGRYRGDDTRLSDVVRQVEDRHQVRVREAEREYEHGRDLYELEVTDADGRWRKLYVTADGDIVRDRRDDD